ncbi:DMT family transporter [Hyperthermus butylicus]|uniref:EamA domain-containing protein n=1 Tax=Hyperthermus butylicus (strain DSM 5456 / JCM 9403 / PLM1-5) TaxID=415426 RepID=A2BK97_HYPBU|nr:DMT family transporter [Hyperthermus butylicus]ABM80408.1 hypothetical protein Hbut_0548 [Hyperthermus butylicus DSM 5456]
MPVSAGLAAIAAAVASWALAPAVISRASSKTSIDPWAFNGWRMLVALAATAPLAWLWEGFPYTTPWLDLVFQLGVIVGGVVSTLAGDSLYVYSISRVGASVAMPVSYLFVIWTALYDYASGAIGPLALAAAALALTGVWLIATSRGGRADVAERERLLAVLAALIASFVWTVSMYAYDAALKRAGYLTVASVRAAYSVAVLAPVMARWSAARLVAGEIVVAGLLGYVTGGIAFLYALTLLPVSIVSIGIALTPVLTQLLSSILASEKLTTRLIAGGLLVLTGLVLASLAHR